MYVLLPAPDSSLSELEQSIDSTNWSEWLKQFAWRMGRVGLPKFAIETGFDARALISLLGVKRAFNNSTSFASFYPARFGGAWLTAAIQKTTLRTDERGTEATSVGLVGGVPGGVAGGSAGGLPPPPPPFEMIVDRPFFFAIADRPTGEILFMCAVVDPQ